MKIEYLVRITFFPGPQSAIIPHEALPYGTLSVSHAYLLYPMLKLAGCGLQSSHGTHLTHEDTPNVSEILLQKQSSTRTRWKLVG